jgi:hypothetical protein
MAGQSFMKSFIQIIKIFCVLMVVPVLEAQVLSAGLYERFYTPSSYSYGSDGAARMRRDIVDKQFSLMTANLRLFYSEEHSQFYFSRPRTPKSGIQDLLIGAVHDELRVVLRPVLSSDPNDEVLKAQSPLWSVQDISKAIVSLKRYLGLYVSLFRKHEVEEFVLPVNLAFLFAKENFKYTEEIFTFISQKSGGKRFHMSIELSELELALLEESEFQDPELFKKVFRSVSRIRLALKDSSMNQESLEEFSHRVLELFPNRSLVLSNVTLPSCEHYRELGKGEYQCLEGSQPLKASLQAERLEQRLRLFDSLHNKNDLWAYFELRYAMTDVEPVSWEAFSEFLMWNLTAQKLIEKFNKGEK